MAGSKSMFATFAIAMLLVSSFAAVVRSEEVDDEEEAMREVVHVEDESEPSDDAPIDSSYTLKPAVGIETVYVFPNHPKKVIPAGQLTELVVGLKNGGNLPLTVLGIKGALVYPIDFRVVVQNFTSQEFNATVPAGVQASFYYTFTPLKQLLPRDFGLSTFIVYEIDSVPYMNVAYNGTIEISEPSGTISGEFIFLFLLGAAFLGLFGFWIRGQFQKLGKRKSKKPKKVETGTKSGGESDLSDNEWLQGTSLTQKAPTHIAQPVRSRKK